MEEFYVEQFVLQNEYKMIQVMIFKDEKILGKSCWETVIKPIHKHNLIGVLQQNVINKRCLLSQLSISSK